MRFHIRDRDLLRLLLIGVRECRISVDDALSHFVDDLPPAELDVQFSGEISPRAGIPLCRGSATEGCLLPAGHLGPHQWRSGI